MLNPVPDEWAEAQRICGLPAVNAAIVALLEDNTGDNAVCVVREVLRAAYQPTGEITRARDLLSSAIAGLDYCLLVKEDRAFVSGVRGDVSSALAILARVAAAAVQQPDIREGRSVSQYRLTSLAADCIRAWGKEDTVRVIQRFAASGKLRDIPEDQHKAAYTALLSLFTTGSAQA